MAAAAFSWATLTASESSVPAATLMIWRFTVSEPTLTAPVVPFVALMAFTCAAPAPAGIYGLVVLTSPVADPPAWRLEILFAPSATPPSTSELALDPRTVEYSLETFAAEPMTEEYWLVPVAVAPTPIAMT